MLKKVADQPLQEEPKAPGADDGAEVAFLHPAETQPEPVADVIPETEAKRRGSFPRIIAASALAVLQAVLMIAILAGSYWVAKRMIADKPEPRKRPAFQAVYTVETVKPVAQDRQPVFTAYGQTIAARSVELRSLVSGEIVAVNPKLRAGGQVATGEKLVEIDTFDYRAALAEAQANLDEAKARIAENEAQITLERSKLGSAREQLELAQTDLERAASLRKRNAVTQQQVEARKLVVSQREQALAVSRDTITVQEARLQQMKASVTRLEWGVDKAQRNLESTVLTAPFQGIVRSSTAEIGRAITANDVVVSMYEAGSLEVTFTLTDAQYGRLQTSDTGLTGRKVELAWIVGGKEYIFLAAIDRIGAEITSNRGGVEVIARLGDITNGVTLRPGAFVEVRVPDVVFKNTYTIPDTAIYGTDTVYALVDGKLVEKPVTIVAFEGEQALISSGLKPGDEILTTRITEVSAGLNVRRERDSAESPTPQGGKGRPGSQDMRKILEANGIDQDAFSALPQADKRAMIRKWQQENAGKASD
ncbi:MAG: efflux RND transporter periplasmic adaptor subunit [Rhizobiaceae bacterium]